MCTYLDEIESVMGELRSLVESKIHRWLDDHPWVRRQLAGLPPTTGFCRGASAAVKLVLAEVFPDVEWRLAGGYGIEHAELAPTADYIEPGCFPGGMIGDDGLWRGHFWVEGELRHFGTVIIDLTADQFGHEPILVTSPEDGRYRRNANVPPEELARPLEAAWGFDVYLDWMDIFGPESRMRDEPRFSA